MRIILNEGSQWCRYLPTFAFDPRAFIYFSFYVPFRGYVSFYRSWK